MKYILPLLLMMTTLLSWGQISVMTYNIRYDNPEDGPNQWNERKEEIVGLLQYYETDIFGLQEALNHQRNYIAQNMSDYASVGFGRDGEGTVSEATPIFYKTTKLEVLATETFWLSPTQEVPSKGWDAALNRIATYAKFRMKDTGKVLHVINTHFDHIGSQAREKSAKLLLERIQQMGISAEPLILMGDLNSEGTDAPIKILSEKLEDSFLLAQNNYGPKGTWNGFDVEAPIIRRIDYIFSKNLETTSCRHIDDRRKNNLQLSDHLPVMVKFLSE